MTKEFIKTHNEDFLKETEKLLEEDIIQLDKEIFSEKKETLGDRILKFLKLI